MGLKFSMEFIFLGAIFFTRIYILGHISGEDITVKPCLEEFRSDFLNRTMAKTIKQLIRNSRHRDPVSKSEFLKDGTLLYIFGF